MSDDHKKTLMEVWAWIKPKSLSELLKMIAIMGGVFFFVFRMGGSYNSIVDTWQPVPANIVKILEHTTQLRAELSIYRSDNTLLKDSLQKCREKGGKGDFITSK